MNSGIVKMKKLIAIALVSVAFVGTANAGDLDLYFDVRDAGAISVPALPYTVSTTVLPGTGLDYPLDNGGGKGDGDILYVSPVLDGADGDAHIEPSTMYNSALNQEIHLYADYNGAAGEVLSSLGASVDLAAAGVYSIADMSFAFDGANWSPSGTSSTVTVAGGELKAVQVPVVAGPMFNASAGINANTNNNLVQVGTMSVDGASRGGVAGAIGVINVNLSVNNLLITRVADPGPAGGMTVSFGYDAGAPEAAVDGSTDGAGAGGAADAVIKVVMKGDYDEDGSVTFNDLNAFLAALNDSGANLNPTDVWKGDYDNDGSVTFNDLNAFLTSLALP
jgi:hypothetical protein